MPEKDKQQMFLELIAKIRARAAEIEQRQIIERDLLIRTKGWSHQKRYPRRNRFQTDSPLPGDAENTGNKKGRPDLAPLFKQRFGS